MYIDINPCTTLYMVVVVFHHFCLVRCQPWKILQDIEHETGQPLPRTPLGLEMMGGQNKLFVYVFRYFGFVT